MSTKHTNILGGSHVLPKRLDATLKTLLPGDLEQWRNYLKVVEETAREEGYSDGYKPGSAAEYIAACDRQE